MSQGVRDIAKLSGVSVATVSRVMNGSTKVTEKTRIKVEQAMRQLNYTPDPAARALATKRSRIIGALVPTIEHSIFATFIEAMEATLTKQGYALVIALTYNRKSLEHERALDLIKLGAEGLIVSGLDHDGEFLNLVDHRDIPLVTTSVFDENAHLPTIGYDNRKLAAEAANYLKGLGHEQMVVIHGATGNNDRTRQRIAGICDIYDESHLTLIETDLSVTGGASASAELFANESRPGAILCLSDVLAQGVMQEAARAGIEIPNDLSLMGFDNLEWSSICHPRLTTIDLPVVDMGNAAAEAIVERLETGTPIRSRLLTGNIIPRESTKAC